MLKKVVVAAALVFILIGGGTTKAPAQEAGTSKAASERSEAPALNAYRLEFSVNEIEDGKKINTRQYSMNLNAEDANEIKIVTPVPVEAKQV